jgi:DNA-binding NtrC family response regulator
MMTLTSAVPAVTSGSLILVVEDEQIIRDLVCEILESKGFVTHARENADLALEYLQQRSADVALLLTDINMPGSMNGAGLAKVSSRQWPSIPIVIMSGFETLESIGIDPGTPFIRKPFTIDEIVETVRMTLTRHS